MANGSKMSTKSYEHLVDKPHALAAVKAFGAAYGAKFPKAAAKITDDANELLAFCDYPAEHWVHLRTTNPIESALTPNRKPPKDLDPQVLTIARAANEINLWAAVRCALCPFASELPGKHACSYWCLEGYAKLSLKKCNWSGPGNCCVTFCGEAGLLAAG